MRTTLERPQLISLAAGFTDDLSLPVEEAGAIVEEILSSPRRGRSALQYGSTAGDPRLREMTAQRLARADVVDGHAGGPVSADRLVITHGSQQLLYLVTESLCDPGDIVLVEDPTYFVYLGILQSHGLRARGVRLTGEGIDVAHLESVLESLKRSGELPRVKMLYLVTYFQNPSGVTTSFETKRAALALLRRYEKAAGHPIYLLEDAAYRELRFAGAGVASALAAPGGAERVIYAGTFSKPFATGIRVGYGVLPSPVDQAVVRIKGNHDFGTANLLQQIVAAAMRTGRYDRHLGELHRRYAAKARAMVSALRTGFPTLVRWVEPEGGLYVWAALPGRVRTGARSRVFQEALRRDVLYVPGELCYAEDPARLAPRNEMRLSFGGAGAGAIREGVRRLGEVLAAELGSKPGRINRAAS